jgi:hypothetical protein
LTNVLRTLMDVQRPLRRAVAELSEQEPAGGQQHPGAR